MHNHKLTKNYIIPEKFKKKALVLENLTYFGKTFKLYVGEYQQLLLIVMIINPTYGQDLLAWLVKLNRIPTD